VIPTECAVFWLMMKLNYVGCWIGTVGGIRRPSEYAIPIVESDVAKIRRVRECARAGCSPGMSPESK
jgi:hypothetical protein